MLLNWFIRYIRKFIYFFKFLYKKILFIKCDVQTKIKNMQKNSIYLNKIQKVKKNKIGDCMLGFIIKFNTVHSYVSIGYHKIFAVINSLELKQKKENWILFFKIENKTIQEIRQNIKKQKNNHQVIYHGYFGFLNYGKIYRLSINISVNFIKKIKKLKILGKKYEYEFALGINGFFWIKQQFPINNLIFLQFIINFL